MGEIIIDNRACLVKMSEEELNYYGELYLRFSPLTMTFESFCRKKVLDDLRILEDRHYQESIWHREVERELKAKNFHLNPSTSSGRQLSW